MFHDTGMRLDVKAENKPFPASAAYAAGSDASSVSKFKLVNALTGRTDAVSLESCRHRGHYLRHNQHNVIVEPPVAPPDAVWLLPYHVSDKDRCINLRAAVSSDLVLTIKPHGVSAVSGSESGTCLRLRAPGKHDVTEENNEAVGKDEQSDADPQDKAENEA